MDELEQVTGNVWVMRFPLRLVATEVGRTVTVLKLNAEKLLIHSTAPFSRQDKAAIEKLGTPAWLADATVFHDTFAVEGMAAFPELPYFAPEGFTKRVRFRPLTDLANLCAAEVEILPLGGMPKVNEHVFYHNESKTLLIADLVFNWGAGNSGWERFVRKYLIGITTWPGTSRLFKMCIKDKAAFNGSLNEVLKRPFKRVIPGHGGIMSREVFEAALVRARV